MVVTFSAFFYLAFVLVGLTHSLGGHFDEFIQPGTKYTFPDNIRRHGASMDTPRGESGWDGQFYYYIADDPLALRDTSAHLDMPRYRYERIGVPLVAYVGSSLAGRGWVSPKFYFATCVALILLASYVLALYVSRAGLSPYWVLLWSLGGAPLFSVCFGFVDGAADALLIIAVVAFLDDRRRWYVLFMTLAILGRESYAVVAISLALVSLSRDLLATSRVEHRLRLGTIVSGVSLQWIHAVPVVVTLAWQLYLNVHLTEGFPVMPGLLAFPFASALHYFLQSVGGQTLSTLDLPGHHLELTFPRYSQAVGLGCFIALVFFAIFRSLHDFVRSRALNKYGTALSSLAAGIALMGLYACLGPTMVWEPVGYVKAASLVWALYLVSAAGLRSRPSSVVGLAAFGIAVFGAYSIYDRVSQPAPLPPEGADRVGNDATSLCRPAGGANRGRVVEDRAPEQVRALAARSRQSRPHQDHEPGVRAAGAVPGPRHDKRRLPVVLRRRPVDRAGRSARPHSPGDSARRIGLGRISVRLPVEARAVPDASEPGAGRLQLAVRPQSRHRGRPPVRPSMTTPHRRPLIRREDKRPAHRSKVRRRVRSNSAPPRGAASRPVLRRADADAVAQLEHPIE